MMLSGLNDHPVELAMETRHIKTAPGMTFDVSASGLDDDALVLSCMALACHAISGMRRFTHWHRLVTSPWPQINADMQPVPDLIRPTMPAIVLNTSSTIRFRL